MEELTGLPALGVRSSLVELVYAALREGILTGTLAPGARLREIPLSRHFGVSTTPIREALRRLQLDGLVDVSPHRGATVTEFSPREVADLYEVREVLERRAARRAAEAPAPDLSHALELIAQARALGPEVDQLTFNKLDVAFHQAVHDVAGNPQIKALASRVHTQIQGVRARMSLFLPGRPAISITEHEALVRAIQEHDAERADAIAERHVLAVRDYVVSYLQENARAAAV